MMGGRHVASATLYEDNTAAISTMLQGPINKSSKSYEIEQFYLVELIEKGEFTVTKVPSADQLGDLFTKVLPQPSFRRLVNKLMESQHATDPAAQ